MRHYKYFFVSCALVTGVVLFSKCIQPALFTNTDPRGKLYAGAQACAGCHKDIYNAYAQNNHSKTSAPLQNHLLKNSSIDSGGKFYFSDSSYVIIENKAGQLLQTCFAGGEKIQSRPFDIAFGSGEKAQTYAYWDKDKLLQLPLSYFTQINAWGNSPGFTIQHARYNRVIEARCFECHAAYVNKQFVQSGTLAVTEKLDTASIIYGIDCERCHGPGLAHAQFQQQHPDVKKATFITAIKQLSRQQQLDACATCHSGNDMATQRSIFSFVPGDTLANFYYPGFGLDKPAPDVHGKQLQLLQLSKCYQRSTITCGTCHSVHTSNVNTAATVVAACLSCHQNVAHNIATVQKAMQLKEPGLETNCINCHMPEQSSQLIRFNNGGNTTVKDFSYFLRTHKIGIY